MPTTPGCQAAPLTSSTARPAAICAAAAGMAASSTPASTVCRWRFTASSRSAISRACSGSSQSSRRRPRSASLMRPPALMRGPSAKPQVMAVGLSRVAATSSSAAMPGRSRAPISFRPCTTSARFRPVSGITSQTVASATRSSRTADRVRRGWRKNRARRSARSGAMAAMKATPAAHRLRKPLVSSRRFGLTVASTGGGGPSALWWSSTITSARPCSRGQRPAAAVPQSTQTTSVAPRSASDTGPQRSGHSLRASGPAHRAAPGSPGCAGTASSARHCRRRPRRNRRTRPPFRRPATAAASRSAAAGMSISRSGSGSRARSVGFRKSAASSKPTPRAARMRADDFGHAQTLRQAKAQPVLACRARARSGRSGFPSPSARRRCRRETAPPSMRSARPVFRVEVVVRLDEADRAAAAAHDQRMRGGAVPVGRTPRSMAPVVTPVAANITSPPASSSIS